MKEKIIELMEEISSYNKKSERFQKGVNQLLELFAQEKEAERKEIFEIVQKEITKADKYEVAPLERIRIKLIQLYDKETNNSKD